MDVPDRIGQLHLPDEAGPLILTRMTAVERLSEPFSIVIDATYRGGPFDLHPHLTKMVGVEFKGIEYNSRWFHGVLWEYVELGTSGDSGDYHYRLTLRPALQIWTLNRVSKIHPNTSIADLITELGTNYWHRSSFRTTYAAVEYRVQYAESNFDFLCRNLEKEGIYYFYAHEATKHTIVFIDTANNHEALVPATVELDIKSGARTGKGVLTTLAERRSFAPTRYFADDYDYTAPTVALSKDKKVETLGSAPPRLAKSTAPVTATTVSSLYDYPAGFASATADAGTRYAERWLEREQSPMARSFAEGTLFAAAVGRTLTIDFSHTVAEGANAEYLIVATTHRYVASGDRSGDEGSDEDMIVELELIPASLQFRPARNTPIPRIHGPQTALVIGPAGEEIYTDKYGRVKVQFFWDKNDDTAPEPRSAWVRVGQSGAGSGFGSFMVPRIGHEVIVEFLDGDPERPIITGAVYNGSNLPAFGSDVANTVQGIKTNSSKGGGGYNEIRIDDAKDKELFSFHAQKDLKTVVDKGDETRDLNEGSRTTIIHKGDETMTVTTGKRTTVIESDETTTINTGNVAHTVSKGDVTRTITAGKRTTEIEGNDTYTIKTGNRATTIKTGNDSLTVTTGNVTIQVDAGAHKTQAATSIELKCGASSFKMTPDAIEIKSLNIKIEGSVALATKGLMVTQEASGVHTIKGATVLIN